MLHSPSGGTKDAFSRCTGCRALVQLQLGSRIRRDGKRLREPLPFPPGQLAIHTRFATMCSRAGEGVPFVPFATSSSFRRSIFRRTNSCQRLLIERYVARTRSLFLHCVRVSFFNRRFESNCLEERILYLRLV